MTCPHEPNVLRAVKEDRWTDSLRGHLADCEDCAAAVSVAPWIDRFSRISDREHILPDPSIVWLKAQLLRGTADVARVARPMTIAQWTAYFVVAFGWAAVLMWKWTAVDAWLHSLTPSGLVSNAARTESLGLSFFAILLVLASMTAMLAVHTILAED